jgi:HSP20 family molecular chaperone IbpA
MLVHVRERRPRADFTTLERDVDRIFRSMWSDPTVPAGVGFDVVQDAEGVTVHADVPGVEPSAINIAVDGRALTISGDRDGRGKFTRTFHLSDDLDTEAIDAQHRNGVLTLRVPKVPAAKPRQIEVKTS